MLLRRYVGSLLSTMIMPSQQMFSQYNTESFEQSRVHLLQTKDHLKFYQYPNKSVKITKDTKIILHAFGNGDCAENHHYELQSYKDKNVIVVGMNFRNVSNSKGQVTSEEDWINDAILITNHYRKLGVPLKNILFNGHSLGAAILTMAAAKIFKEELATLKKTIKEPTQTQINNCAPRLINNRSFTTLADEIMISLLGRITGLFAGAIVGLATLAFFTTSAALIAGSVILASSFIYPQLAEFILRPVLDAILWLGFGRMDAYSAYKTLPEETKECIIAKDDLVINKRATIYHQEKNQRRELKKAIEHSQDKKKSELREKLCQIKDSKLHYSDDNVLSLEAHNVPLNYLRTYHKLRNNSSENNKQISGQEVMENKCKQLLKL
ncbi:MAG: hypothetical protein HYX61_00185 [Gammaproteobacteria bacterium]|jgi:hypothetical protein|nr:hypothetical protein [Gammaproteobacteria bacterium]